MTDTQSWPSQSITRELESHGWKFGSIKIKSGGGRRRVSGYSNGEFLITTDKPENWRLFSDKGTYLKSFPSHRTAREVAAEIAGQANWNKAQQATSEMAIIIHDATLDALNREIQDYERDVDREQYVEGLKKHIADMTAWTIKEITK